MRQSEESVSKLVSPHYLQEKENSSGSPEKQVDKETREEGGTKFSSLYKSLKQPSKIGRTMSENLSVPLAFIGMRIVYTVHLPSFTSFQLSFISVTNKI